MARKNIFLGKGKYPLFANNVYKLFMKGDWFNYMDVVKVTSEGPSDYKSVASDQVSKTDSYGELRKAFRDVTTEIEARAGKDSVEQKGNNRNRVFRYVGQDRELLHDMLLDVERKGIADLRDFCLATSGFLPVEWVDYFLRNSLEHIDIMKFRRKPIISTAEADVKLTNKNLIPDIYEHIINKRVLRVEYDHDDQDTLTREHHVDVFSPHHLREYNSRWHVFGVFNNHVGDDQHIALDRIRHIEVATTEKFIEPSSADLYATFFDDIIGLTHFRKDGNLEPIEDVTIRVHNLYMFNLVTTKPFHSSQKTTKPFADHPDGRYGEITLRVRFNLELQGAVLQMGRAVEVVSPASIRQKIKDEVAKLYDLYK